MKKFFVGIDVSKNTFDVAYHNGADAVYLNQFENNETGYQAMLQQLKQVTKRRTSSWFFCFENTGVYSKVLFDFLSANNYACREENPVQINQSLDIKRGKDDKADAKDICQYAFEKRDSIEASKPLCKQLTNLRKTLSYRDLLVRKRVAIEVALKDQKQALILANLLYSYPG